MPFLAMQKRGRERDDGTVVIVACTDPRVCPEESLGMGKEERELGFFLFSLHWLLFFWFLVFGF